MKTQKVKMIACSAIAVVAGRCAVLMCASSAVAESYASAQMVVPPPAVVNVSTPSESVTPPPSVAAPAEATNASTVATSASVTAVPSPVVAVPVVLPAPTVVREESKIVKTETKTVEVVAPPSVVGGSVSTENTAVALAPEFERGAVCSVYFEKGGVEGNPLKDRRRRGKGSNLKHLLPKLMSGGIPSLLKFYDNDVTRFEKKITDEKNSSKVKYNIVKWEGYLKIKKGGKYTFLVNYPMIVRYATFPRGQFEPECALVVNEERLIVPRGNQDTMHLELKSGMNKFCLVTLPGNFSSAEENATVHYKPFDSMVEPREIRPNDIFHSSEGKSDW